MRYFVHYFCKYRAMFCKIQIFTEQIVWIYYKIMQTTVKERLIAYLKSQGVSQRAFEQQIGVSNGYVNNIRVSIQPEKIQRIAKCYPNLNIDWLLLGSGTMIKDIECVSTGNITISREVFNQIRNLVESICSLKDTLSNQQQMISDQHRTIDRLLSERQQTKQAEYDIMRREDSTKSRLSDIHKPYNK